MVSEYYIGLMSGTSLDGIDGILVDLSSSEPIVVQKSFLPYPESLKLALLDLHLPQTNELHFSLQIANQLARLYAQVVDQLLDLAQMPAQNVVAIGNHGQTIRHNPSEGYTVQIGNSALLAELTGITVVSDFRSRDIAAGGQGAPLVPAFHHQVMRHEHIHRVIVNVGGISNLTNLAPNLQTCGFDCGPGNLLMDAWCKQHLGVSYDKDGAWAASGRVIPVLLESFLHEPFFHLPPPKSTGRDLFHQQWLEQQLLGRESPADVQATLLELTARSISDAILTSCIGAKEVYLCGGGARNGQLRRRIEDLLPCCKVDVTTALGVDADYLEALAFAWLAQQTLRRQAANLPEVTGARHPCVLGAIYFA